MTDEPTNPHYRLKVAAERAREAAEVSLDPLDHVVKNAMASVVEIRDPRHRARRVHPHTRPDGRRERLTELGLDH